MNTDEPEGSLPEETEQPGDEIDKDHRDVINDLVSNQGWRYKKARGGGYPRLYPADSQQTPIKVPKTGHTKGRAFTNWVAEIRRKGGHWPPERKQP